MARFDGKTIVVTGGTGFLGTGVCERLLDEGAHLVLAWVNDEELERFPFADRCTMSQVDLTDEHAVEAFYEAIGPIWGSIHIAGGFAMSPIESTSLAEMEAMMRLNLATAFLCCREAVKAIRAANTGGRIVNVAARPCLEPVGGMLAYSTSKAAVASLTQCLAKEVHDDRILVNAIVPSLMDTPSNRSAMADADFDTWPKVEEVAAAVAFLASEENALTTGTLLPVYGRV